MAGSLKINGQTPKTQRAVMLLMLFMVVSLNIVGAQKTVDNQKKVNKLNLLLPELYEDLEVRAPQYMLEASNGCYSWSSTRPDYLDITGYPDESNPRCESHALVKLNNIRPYDNIIWIAVTDKDTGDVMRVESKIAKVQKIEILTKLRTIDVGDLSVLEIIGYDKEGNSFSSLEGLRFEWSISQEENIFEFITFKESKIKTSVLRKKLEAVHFQTDIVVIKALQTGKADVSVKIKENGQTLASLAVTLYAIDKFDIFPSTDLYLLPQAKLQYELLYTKKATDKLIKLPNAEYKWTILNPEVGSIEQNGQLTTHEKLPNVPTKVVVRPSKDVDFSVSSTVTVVYPHSLEIFSREFTSESWEASRRGYYQEIFEKSTHFVRNREYYLRVVLYDQHKNEIKITPNSRIEVTIDNTKFDVIEKRNHELHVRPKVLTSSTVISAQLVDVKGKLNVWKPEREIKNRLSISIVMPVKLFKPSQYLHLPNQPDQIFKLRVLGGSGSFEWDTSNPTIAVASFNRVHPKSIGSAVLHVSDKMNEKNFDTIEVRVSSIVRAVPLEQMKEVLIHGSGSTYGIALPGIGPERFSNCSAVSFGVESNPFYSSIVDRQKTYEEMLSEIEALKKSNVFIESEISKYALKSFESEFTEYIATESTTKSEIQSIYNEYNNYGICSGFSIQAIEAGEYRAKLIVENTHLAVHVDQYISVKVLLPFSNIINQQYFQLFKKDEVVVSMGSSYEWRFKYGPSQWESFRKINLSTTINKLSKGCDNGVSSDIPASTTQGNITQSYTLSCSLCSHSAENSYSVKIFAQNQADGKLPRPLLLFNEITVWCNVPHALYIYPLAGSESTSLYHHAKTSKFNKYHLQTEMTHFFSSGVFDSRGLPFANYSSLAINWSITTQECGPLDTLIFPQQYKDKFRQNIQPAHLDHKKDEFRRFELNKCTNLASKQDVIKIHASSAQLEIGKSTPIPFSVNDEILLAVAQNVECSPQDSLVYNHPDNKFAVSLLYGSGFYDITNNATDVVYHTLLEKQNKVQFKTKNNGVALIRVDDTLQIGAKRIECRVQVRDPARIDLKLEQDIIPVGASTHATVEVYDDQNRPFSHSQLALMEIFLESDTSDNEGRTLAIKRDSLNGHRFFIDGKKRGNYRLVAALRSGTTQMGSNFFIIKSNSLDLEVFPQLEAYPAKIVLHPNCQTSLQLLGGPSDSTRVRFSYQSISQNGASKNEIFDLTQLDTKLYDIRARDNQKGNSTLEFNIHLQPNNTLLSRVTVPVTVNNIDDVKIFGMNDRTLHQTTTVRLIAQMFITGELMTTGICPLTITWISKVEGVLRIQQNISPEIISTTDSSDSSKNPVSIGDSHLYAVNATALEVGIAEIELTVAFKGQKNAVVRTVARVDVINPVAIPIPTYVAHPDIKPSILLIPPKSGYFMPLQNPLKYTFSTSCGSQSFDNTQSDSIRVDHNGHITTGDKKGVSSQVRAISNSLQQEIMSVHVYTTSVYSLFVENSHEVVNMQVEGETVLQVRMQDFLGRSFPTTLDNVSLRVKVTNTKVLSAVISDGSQLNLRAISAGTSIVTVYLEANPHIYDIFFVNVGSIVTPSSPVYVHIGGIIQFSVLQGKNRNQNSSQKRWSSSNDNILSIDASRGLSKSHQEGEAIVQFNDIVSYKSKVIVQKVGEIIRSDLGKTKKLTNDPNHSEFMPKYVIPFQAFLKDRNGGRELLKRLENTLEKNSINNNLVWDCSTDQPDWFIVTAEVIDLPNGEQQPQCIVKLVEPAQYKTKVELNKAIPKQEIYIQTTLPLEFSYGGNDIRQHVLTKFYEQQSVQKIEIYVSTGYNLPIDSSITVKHPLTSQSETIRVLYDPDSYDPSTGQQDNKDSSPFTWTDYLITFILIGATIVILQSLSKK